MKTILMMSAAALAVAPAAAQDYAERADAAKPDAYTDTHALIDAGVAAEGGTEIGTVERVRLAPNGDVAALVVETGGVLEIGGREVLIPAEEASWEGEAAETVTLAYSRTEFDALPSFDEDAASEFPLSDRSMARESAAAIGEDVSETAREAGEQVSETARNAGEAISESAREAREEAEEATDGEPEADADAQADAEADARADADAAPTDITGERAGAMPETDSAQPFGRRGDTEYGAADMMAEDRMQRPRQDDWSDASKAGMGDWDRADWSDRMVHRADGAELGPVMTVRTREDEVVALVIDAEGEAAIADAVVVDVDDISAVNGDRALRLNADAEVEPAS